MISVINWPIGSAPVAQMDVADDLVTLIAQDVFETLTDDCRAQMADVHGFSGVRSAVVNYYSA